MVHGAGDNMTAAIRNDGFNGTATQEQDGCGEYTLYSFYQHVFLIFLVVLLYK